LLDDDLIWLFSLFYDDFIMTMIRFGYFLVGLVLAIWFGFGFDLIWWMVGGLPSNQANCRLMAP
jgi:hypothetical protein